MSSRIQARIDEDLKAEGEQILGEIGLTTTDLIRMTFKQLVMRKGLPFDVHIPNSETIAAFKEAKNSDKLTTYPDVKSAMDDMWSSD
jgi:DNA-damage-inducible protein J